ncbi:MAG: hypothetical protein WC926_00250 [Candidatus Paceibacterota bacterium]|jgi:hypothetical protein
MKNMEDFKGLKKAVYGAENITILTQNDPSQDATGAALALFFSLKNIGKNVNIPTIPEIPRKIADRFKKPAKKTFLISLKKDISEIYYEKKEGEVNLYLKPREDDISASDLSFKTIADHEAAELPSPDFPKPDLVIVLGMPAFQDVEKGSEFLSARIPLDIKMINIDNSPLNQKYADFNILKDFSSLSQVCAYFLRNLDQNIVDDNAASSLLYGAGSLLKTAGKKNGRKALPFFAWTIKRGGDLSLILGVGEANPAGKRLLDRTLKKLEPCGCDIFCSILTAKDFCLAEASSKDLGFVVEKLKSCFNPPSFLLLWESCPENAEKKTMGIFYSENEETAKRIGRIFNGQNKGNGTLFPAGSSDPATAQKEVLNAINK